MYLDSNDGPRLEPRALAAVPRRGFRMREFECFNRPEGACIPSGNAKLHEAGVKHRREGSRRKQAFFFSAPEVLELTPFLFPP